MSWKHFQFCFETSLEMKSSVLILSVLSFVFAHAHAQDGGEKVAFCTFDTDEGDVQGNT